MKDFRWLILGFTAGAMFAFAPACGPSKSCTAQNCSGCCDATNTCQPGSSSSSCGTSAHVCAACSFGQLCNLGVCTTNGQGNGQGGGGTTGTGGGTTGTGGGTTGTGGGSTGTGGGSTGTGGGSTGTGGGSTGTGGGSTGTGGGSTGTGGGSTGTGGGGSDPCTDGCFAAGQCLRSGNNARDGFCGTNGVSCVDCSTTGRHCSNFTCVTTGTGGGSTGTGGGSTGTGGGSAGTHVGTPCTSSSQCTALGSGAFCKLQTVPLSGAGTQPTAFPTGFCSKTCTGFGTCGAGSVCAGGTSSFVYLFDDTQLYCTEDCSSSGTGGTCSASGLACFNDISGADSTVAVPGCWFDPNGSVFPPYTGGGTPTKLGNACTSDTDCANPPDPGLAACFDTWPGGYCLASNEFGPTSWCGSGGTEIGFNLPDGGVDFFCAKSCTPGSGRSGRTGYTCRSQHGTDGGVTAGFLFPACDAMINGTVVGCSTTGSFTQCNATNGLCCQTSTSSNCSQ